jgi:hypothetical protein
MHVKLTRCVSGGFSGGLLPVLPVSCQKRPEAVLAVRTITGYVKSSVYGISESLPCDDCQCIKVMKTGGDLFFK